MCVCGGVQVEECNACCGKYPNGQEPPNGAVGEVGKACSGKPVENNTIHAQKRHVSVAAPAEQIKDKIISFVFPLPPQLASSASCLSLQSKQCKKVPIFQPIREKSSSKGQGKAKGKGKR